MNLKICKVTKAYTSAYPDPIKVKVGETLKVGDKKSDWPGWTWCINQEGKGGWLPDSYIKKSDLNCTVLYDYEATELTVKTGETLIAEKEVNGWLWCRNKKGMEGWVPSETIQ